jgi:hypothetical protein
MNDVGAPVSSVSILPVPFPASDVLNGVCKMNGGIKLK